MDDILSVRLPDADDFSDRKIAFNPRFFAKLMPSKNAFRRCVSLREKFSPLRTFIYKAHRASKKVSVKIDEKYSVLKA